MEPLALFDQKALQRSKKTAISSFIILFGGVQPVGGILAAKNEEELSSGLRIKEKYEEMTKGI